MVKQKRVYACMLPLFPLFTPFRLLNWSFLPTANYNDWQKHDTAKETVALETAKKNSCNTAIFWTVWLMHLT